MKTKFAVLYCGDVEVSGEAEEFKALEEAQNCVKSLGKGYTPPSAYWVIYEFVKKTEGKFTEKRY